jgi:hydrogenase maturation protease
MTAVVIGYGNTLRGDDGAGPKVAEAVAALELPGVRALAVPQLTPELAQELVGARVAVFVDAAMNSAGGGVEILRVAAAERPESAGHTSDPGVLLALADAVYGAHLHAWLVRVPAADFAFGTGLSACASRGTTAALREVLRLVGSAAPRLS